MAEQEAGVTHRLTHLGPANEIRDPERGRIHRAGEPVDVSSDDADRLRNLFPREQWSVVPLEETEEGDAR